MPRVEFAGQSARDADNPAGNPSRLINGYRVPMVPGPFRCRPAGRAGHGGFRRVGDVFVRAMSNFDGGIMAIVGTNLHRIETDGTVTLIGDVDATDAIAGLDQSTGYAVAVAGRKVLALERNDACNCGGRKRAKPGVRCLSWRLCHRFGLRNAGVWMVSAGGSMTWGGLDFASAEITPTRLSI